jgi:methylenetetrahydrofolate--tRNA-(uracil-5-)-methyltransferase
LAGINAARALAGQPLVTPPPTTAHGCLIAHIAMSDPRRFQPMNTNFGLFPPLSRPVRDKEKKRQSISQRALEDFDSWKTQSALS